MGDKERKKEDAAPVSTADKRAPIQEHGTPKAVADGLLEKENKKRVDAEAKAAQLKSETHNTATSFGNAAVSDSLQYLAKELHTLTASSAKWRTGDAGGPSVNGITTDYNKAMSEVARISALVALDSNPKTLAPDVSVVQGAAWVFDNEMRLAQNWMAKNQGPLDVIKPDAVGKAAAELTKLIGLEGTNLGQVRTPPTESEPALERTMAESHVEASEKLVASIAAGNSTDNSHLVAHLRFVVEHLNALKSRSGLAKVKALVTKLQSTPMSLGAEDKKQIDEAKAKLEHLK